jgi:hypothetical protein
MIHEVTPMMQVLATHLGTRLARATPEQWHALQTLAAVVDEARPEPADRDQIHALTAILDEYQSAREGLRAIISRLNSLDPEHAEIRTLFRAMDEADLGLARSAVTYLETLAEAQERLDRE